MPEKPEVITVANSLKKKLLGKRIIGCNIYWNNIIAFPLINQFKKEIANQRINDIHTHVELLLDSNISFRFHDVRKFGKMYLIPIEDTYNVKPLSDLGIEYYDSSLTSNYLYDKICNKKISIKTVLLDQSILTGIGNIYDDEILFMSGVSPFRKACDVSLKECQKIVDNFKIVMEKAISLGGTTIKSFTSEEGVHGLFQNELLVHGKEGSSCPKCGNVILKTKIGGRGTYYCKNCQK